MAVQETSQKIEIVHQKPVRKAVSIAAGISKMTRKRPLRQGRKAAKTAIAAAASYIFLKHAAELKLSGFLLAHE